VETDDTRELANVLSKNGQALLPMVTPIEQSKVAVDELIEALGRATTEAVLGFSALEIAVRRVPERKGRTRWAGPGPSGAR